MWAKVAAGLGFIGYIKSTPTDLQPGRFPWARSDEQQRVRIQ